MVRTTRPLVIVAAFAGSLVVGLVLMLWALGGLKNVAAPAAIGGPFQLTDQAGRTVTEKNLQGRPTLIFFGFTHCPDICPTSLFEISELLRAMGKDADRVNAYFISVDPERDTTEAMKDYLSSFDPHLEGLTGNPDQVAKVISAYRVYARKVAPAIVVAGAALGAAVLLGTLVLWFHYGTAVFFEMIASGIAACF